MFGMGKRIVAVLGLFAVFFVAVVGFIISESGQSYATETYNFRQVNFEKGSQCAEYFTAYQMAAPYDYMVKVPALMKFDNGCNPIAP